MQHHWIDLVTRAVFIASIAHSCLPPWDFLNDYPRIQKAYKVLVYLVGYIAINARSTVYTQISTQKTGGVNESVAHIEAPPDEKKQS